MPWALLLVCMIVNSWFLQEDRGNYFSYGKDLDILIYLYVFGVLHLQKLGFASCHRSPGATEGINVLIEKKEINGNWAYGFSCIEYTEFDKFGLTGTSSSKRWGLLLNLTIISFRLADHEPVYCQHSWLSILGSNHDLRLANVNSWFWTIAVLLLSYFSWKVYNFLVVKEY